MQEYNFIQEYGCIYNIIKIIISVLTTFSNSTSQGIAGVRRNENAALTSFWGLRKKSGQCNSSAVAMFTLQVRTSLVQLTFVMRLRWSIWAGTCTSCTVFGKGRSLRSGRRLCDFDSPCLTASRRHPSCILCGENWPPYTRKYTLASTCTCSGTYCTVLVPVRQNQSTDSE